MNTSSATVASSAGIQNYGAFFERLWRLSGVNFILFAVIAVAITGFQPKVGASVEVLAAFYGGEPVRIAIGIFVTGLATLNLLWFVAALRTALVDAGTDGWGTSAIIASAMVGAILFLLLAVRGVLAYSIAGSGNPALLSGLNDLTWAGAVLSSFPRAMLIMAGSFGLWRGGLISSAGFAAGVTALGLVLLGGGAWIPGGLFAPDGAYTRFVSPAIGVVWILAVTRVLLARPSARAAW